MFWQHHNLRRHHSLCLGNLVIFEFDSLSSITYRRQRWIFSPSVFSSSSTINNINNINKHNNTQSHDL
ncbi:uncharacterized protein LAJ45_00450 [Morchella importuna]|uniref:uncharacterized protein n=1 Tax=Morchella importuna TaxID=1174673 RepID=UPI001E8CC726|nr:uncharacterized protein LAJ45_00450 [Morchella importuna]KAH8155440.1 hypothetical protein LAJ45_00450 [Morchella importuna]